MSVTVEKASILTVFKTSDCVVKSKCRFLGYPNDIEVECLKWVPSIGSNCLFKAKIGVKMNFDGYIELCAPLV